MLSSWSIFLEIEGQYFDEFLSRPSCRSEGSLHLRHGGGGSDLPRLQDRVLETAEANVRKKEGEGDEEVPTLPNETKTNGISLHFIFYRENYCIIQRVGSTHPPRLISLP